MKRLTNIIHLTALIVLIVLPANLHAANMTMTTYYPALSGEYDQLRLLPRSVNLTGPCTVGTLYVNSANTIQYCHDNSGVGNWGPVTDVWTQNGDDIFPTDTLTQPNLFVGIGTKTPEFKLSIQNDAGIIAKGTFGSGIILPNGLNGDSRLIWYPRKAAFRAGRVTTFGGGLTTWDDQFTGIYSTAFGVNTIADGNYSIVGGGDNNTASGNYSNVIGGQNNTASGDYSSIIGGASNRATQQYAIVTGGASNQATANYATIVGGQSNTASAIYTTVGGGSTNTVSTPYSNINGGQNNIIDQILGVATGYSVIGGGYQNQARNDYTVISGGSTNTVIASYASIGGGLNNTAGLLGASLIGLYSRISGGEANTASADYTTISGGRSNTASGIYSTIGGGWGNTASGDYSAIGGGERNTTSHYSMIMGGTDNIINSSISWAGGKNMQLTAAANHTFVWGYSDTPISIATADAFIIAPGVFAAGNPWSPKVGIRDINPVGVVEINANGSNTDNFIIVSRTTTGDVFVVNNNGYIGVNKATPTVATYAMQFGNANNAYLSGGGVWTNGSSRNTKENIESLTSQTAQDTLDQLNPVAFNYKVRKQPSAGFIAEDVPASVAMKDRKSLSSMDIIAVLTKVAQDQEQTIQEQKKIIDEIQNEIAKLKRMTDL